MKFRVRLRTGCKLVSPSACLFHAQPAPRELPSAPSRRKGQVSFGKSFNNMLTFPRRSYAVSCTLSYPSAVESVKAVTVRSQFWDVSTLVRHRSKPDENGAYGVPCALSTSTRRRRRGGFVAPAGAGCDSSLVTSETPHRGCRRYHAEKSHGCHEESRSRLALGLLALG